MRLGDASNLIKAPPLGRDQYGGILPFIGHEKRSERAVAEGLHRIITLSLECWNTWLRPLLPRSRKAEVSSVQDQDPYLESLLRALHSHK